MTETPEYVRKQNGHARGRHRGSSIAEAVLEHTVDGVVTIDASGIIHSFNPAASRIFGYAADEVIGRNVSLLMGGDDARHHDAHLQRYMATGKAGIIGIGREVEGVRKDGTRVPLYLGVSEVAVPEGRLFAGILRDITREKAREAQLAYEASHDALTGLHNRREFGRRLEAAVDADSGFRGALLYLDLDHFKPVNDTLGHAAGDVLLQQLADTLVASIPDHVLLARVGGDEFTLLMPRCDLQCGERLAQRVLGVISSFRFYWDNQVFRLGASIGVSAFAPGSDPDEVVSRADTACRLAKETGRTRVMVFDPGEPGVSHREAMADWALRLPIALANGQLRLHAQPIVPTHRADGAGWTEVLARLARDSGALEHPNIFMAAAENYQQVARLDLAVVREVLARLQSHPPAARPRVSVNLSGQTLTNGRVCAELVDLLDRSGCAPWVIIEVTESAPLTSLQRTVHQLQRFRDLGARVAIDDFGAGMSSLSYLAQLPFDIIKLDGELVQAATRDRRQASIVRAVCEVAHAFDAEVVAEFVETESMAERMTELGVHYLQGYLFGRPEAWQ